MGIVCVGMRYILSVVLAQNWYGVNVLDDAVRVKREKNTPFVPEAHHSARVVFVLLLVDPVPGYY